MRCCGMPYLLGHLPKVADEPQNCASDQGVPEGTKVHSVTVEIGVKGVHGLHGSWTLLLISKDKVYPVVEVGADEVAFQGLEPKTRRDVGT